MKGIKKKKFDDNDWNWASNRQNLGGHDFQYAGSGVIYKCYKCGAIEDLFNLPERIKKCKKR